MAQVAGQSVTISEPTEDRSWTVLRGGHLTLESGGSFAGGTQVSIVQSSSYTVNGGDTADTSTTIGQQSTATISGGKVIGEWAVAQRSTVTISGGKISGEWTIVQASKEIIMQNRSILTKRALG